MASWGATILALRIQDFQIKVVDAKARLHPLTANLIGLEVLLLVDLIMGLNY